MFPAIKNVSLRAVLTLINEGDPNLPIRNICLINPFRNQLPDCDHLFLYFYNTGAVENIHILCMTVDEIEVTIINFVNITKPIKL